MYKFGQNPSIHSRDFSNNLSLTVTLKMESRSSKSNQFFSMSQEYRCTSLVKIHLLIQEIGCIQPLSNNLSPPVTLEMGSNSPKSNQFFYMSQHCRYASLVEICSFLQEIGYRQAIFQQSKPSCDLENGVKVT